MFNTHKLDHIGIAVHSLDDAKTLYQEALGLKLEGREEVAEQGIKTDIYHAGETRIELLEPLSPDSPVGKFLAKRGPGVHHLAFTVDNLEQALADMKQKGFTLIDETPRVGVGGMRIAFLHPKDTMGVLIELNEEVAP